MDKEHFNEMLSEFFKAIKEKTLLIVIDSASKYEKAVFSLVSFRKKNSYGYGYNNYAPLLKEIGMKNYGKHEDLFVTHCAGRFSLYILDNIGIELKRYGVKLPKDWHTHIQSQNCI